MIPRRNLSHQSTSSHLFTLRMWLEDLGSGQKDWRGKVQHVSSGDALYFRDWQILESFVEKILFMIESGTGHEDENEDETHI